MTNFLSKSFLKRKYYVNVYTSSLRYQTVQPCLTVYVYVELGFFSFIALRTAQNLTLNTMKNLILETLFDTKKSRPLDSLAWYRHFNKQWWG